MQVTAGYLYFPAEPKKKLPAELQVALLAPAIVGSIVGADAAAPYHLALSPSVLSDDHFCIVVGKSGLLQTVGVVSSDRSADIAEKIAETIAIAATGVPTGLPFNSNIESTPKRRTGGVVVWDKAPFGEFLFDPHNAAERAAVQQEVLSALERRIESVNADPSGALKATDRAIDAKITKFSTESNLALRMLGSEGLIRIVGGLPGDLAKAPGAAVPGVYYRAPVERVFSVAPAALIGGKAQTSTAALPDRASTAWIAVTRAPIVRKQTSLSLTDGMLTSINVNKPSDGLAAASMPLGIAGAVIETPARFFTSIAKATKSETALLSAKADLLKAEAEFLKVQEGKDGTVAGGEAFAAGTPLASAVNPPQAFASGLTCAGQ